MTVVPGEEFFKSIRLPEHHHFLFVDAIMAELLVLIGSLTVIWYLCGIIQLIVALINSCDFFSALTPVLPKDAFKDKIVWISGASSGIGREMTLILAKQGAKLIISARNKDGLEQVAKECQEINPNADINILPLDLASDCNVLVELAKEALGLFGRIDVLINNGGVSTRVMARDSGISVDQYITQVDYLAHVAVTKTILPVMEGLKEARIINIGSVASKIGAPARTAYCGAKHALLGFMNALQTETVLNGHSHINILNIILGSTSTSLPTRAVVGMSKDGKPATFLGIDPNIAGGMNANVVANRILAISYQKSSSEAWIAKGKELIVLFLNQYFPKISSFLLVKTVGKQYLVKVVPNDEIRVKSE